MSRGRSTHRVGEPLPSIMLLRDLAPVLGLSPNMLWRLEQEGELKSLETDRRLGNRVRYSGVKVQQFLNGVQDDAAVMGPQLRKRA